MSETFLDEFLDGPGETAPDSGLRDQIVDKLKSIYDPEIPVNIYELGLIYGLDVSADKDVKVTMTLTTPMCPVAESMPAEVEAKVREVDGVNEVNVELVWEPAWDMSKLSEAAKLELGML
jgi:FeS assembly SUF system protein